MATIAAQTFIRSCLTDRSGPVDTAVASGTINSGDAVYWTGLGFASLTTAGASNANAANFFGISRDTYPMAVAGGGIAPGGSNTTGIVEYGVAQTPGNTVPPITVAVEGEFQFKTTAAQSFAPFAKVYLGADGQTVSTTVLGVALGTVAINQRAVGSSLGGTVAGAVGQNVVIHIAPAIV
ncbi:MAG: hypothetical protein NVSMB19_25350 [Vulcanimicrobiaceae bacterium]